MLRNTVVLLALAGASAFAPVLPSSGRALARRGPVMQRLGSQKPKPVVTEEPSESVPFLAKPAKLDSSLAGYAGFDPLGFSNSFDVAWLQETEIKNGRIAMLGVVGLLVPEFYTFPQLTAGATAAQNFNAIPAEGWLQIFLFLGNIDVYLHSRAPRGSIRFNLNGDAVEERPIPGDFGFDPLGFGSDPQTFAELQLKEIKNARLAMIAFGGILHQQLITKTGTIAYLKDFHPGFGPFN